MEQEGIIVKRPVEEGEKQNKRVNIPVNMPILYTDAVYINSGRFGVTLDFAQSLGPTNQQNIVARLGMSFEHAKALLASLRKVLEKVPDGDKKVS